MKEFLTRNGKSIPLPCLFLYVKEDGQIHCSTHVQAGPGRFTYVSCSIDPTELMDFWQLFLKDPCSALEVYFKHTCLYEEGPRRVALPLQKPKAVALPELTLADLGLLVAKPKITP